MCKPSYLIILLICKWKERLCGCLKLPLLICIAIFSQLPFGVFKKSYCKRSPHCRLSVAAEPPTWTPTPVPNTLLFQKIKPQFRHGTLDTIMHMVKHFVSLNSYWCTKNKGEFSGLNSVGKKVAQTNYQNIESLKTRGNFSFSVRKTL